MIVFSKVASQLLLPPSSLILLMAIALAFWQKVWAKPLIMVSIAVLWLLSTEPVRDALTYPLEFEYSALNIENLSRQPTVIVLLGSGIQEKSPEYQGHDELPPSSMVRTIYAARIAKKTGFDVYPTGGVALTQNAETESHIMKRWLIWFGVPEQNIVLENKASTTWENATFTKKILAQQNINNIILVTSAWHMPRAFLSFKSPQLKVIPAPTGYLTKQAEYDLKSFLPHWSVLSDSSTALHEYLGLLWYKIIYQTPLGS